MTPKPAAPAAAAAPVDPPAHPIRWTAFLAVFILIVVVYGCAIYANLSYAVTNRADYKYFPPFKAYNNANDNKHLGAEYYNIAQAMVAGKGFANPFKEDTGPTAWMPPMLPAILAALLWITDNDREAVMAIVIFLQVNSIIATGVLVLALVLRTTQRMWALAAMVIFLAFTIGDFRQWFQTTHDCWLVLLTLDILIAWLVWGNPLGRWYIALGWGIFGGLCAMVSPIVALSWGVTTIAVMFKDRAWKEFGIAILLAAVTLAPWTIRNYLVFGKLLPVKSNAAYELWQSQCKQKDGMLHHFDGHPYGSAGRERSEYKEVGEIKFIDRRRELFWQSVKADPLDFADRVSCRFMGATLWYMPFSVGEETRRPVVTWLSRIAHPLPFLALLVLGFSALFKRLTWPQWAVMAIYVLYLFPYIAVSYYERYAMPLLGVKILLVLWAADRLLCLIPWGKRAAAEEEVEIAELAEAEEVAVAAVVAKPAVKPKPAISADAKTVVKKVVKEKPRVEAKPKPAETTQPARVKPVVRTITNGDGAEAKPKPAVQPVRPKPMERKKDNDDGDAS